MKCESLELMCCPVCKGDLSLLEHQRGNEAIWEGTLSCKRCRLDFPIERGIPRFISAKELVGPNRKFERIYNRMSYLYDSEFFLASRVRRSIWPSGEELARIVGQGSRVALAFLCCYNLAEWQCSEQ